MVREGGGADRRYSDDEREDVGREEVDGLETEDGESIGSCLFVDVLDFDGDLAGLGNVGLVGDLVFKRAGRECEGEEEESEGEDGEGGYGNENGWGLGNDF